MSTTEDLLREALHARADRTTYEPTSVADVATRARFEQRRQTRGRVLVAAAAAAAVALPVGLVLGTGPDSSPEPAGPTEPVTVRIDSLTDLEQGAPPAIDHVDGSTYVFASGERLELSVEPGVVLDAAPYRGGALVSGAGDPEVASLAAGLTWFDRDGTERWTRCGSPELTVSVDGNLSAHAYIDGGDCSQWTGPVLAWGPASDDAPDKDIVTPNGERVEPVAVTEDHVLYNTTATVGRQRQAVMLTTELGPPEQVPGLANALTYDEPSGLVGGCPVDGRCGLFDVADGTAALTLDDREVPRAFSPDGRHLLTTTIADGHPGILTVRDVETGDPVVRMDGGEDTYLAIDTALAWEDDEHLLFGRVDRTGQALVRLGLDGSLELATPLEEPTLGGYLLPGS